MDEHRRCLDRGRGPPRLPIKHCFDRGPTSSRIAGGPIRPRVAWVGIDQSKGHDNFWTSGKMSVGVALAGVSPLAGAGRPLKTGLCHDGIMPLGKRAEPFLDNAIFINFIIGRWGPSNKCGSMSLMAPTCGARPQGVWNERIMQFMKIAPPAST